MSQNLLPLKIRQAISEDVNFLFNSWLKSFRDAGYFSYAVPTQVFYPNQHKLIENIFKRAQVFMACDPDDESHVYGYAVGERIDGILVLHYIYVKHDFRKLGIARELINSFSHDGTTAACCTHLTKSGTRLLAKFNIVYHPYLAWIDYTVPTE